MIGRLGWLGLLTIGCTVSAGAQLPPVVQPVPQSVEPVVSWTFVVTSGDQAVVVSERFARTTATCDRAQEAPSTSPVTSPQWLVWDDPATPGRDCRLDIRSWLARLTPGEYLVTLTAHGATQTSEPSTGVALVAVAVQIALPPPTAIRMTP